LENHKQASLDDELLKLIANQVLYSPYNMVMAMSIVAYLMFRHIPDKPLIWGGWMLLVIVSQVYRISRLKKLPFEQHVPVKERTRQAARINFACTFIQSLSFLAFPILTPFEASVQSMMFLAMGVGSIVAAVGWAPFALTHIWASLAPMFAMWAWSGLFGPAGVLGILVALIGTAYSFTMWSISNRLFKMNQEFFENRAALGKALDDAEEAGVAKTRFLAAASHDLRQPVHTLSLFSAALGLRPLDNRTQHISENIDAAINALSSQLDALLDVSKLDAKVVDVNLDKVRLDKLFSRLCEEYQGLAEKSDIEMVNACPFGATAKTDPVLLERLARNIITNAIKHNANCKVTVTVQLTSGSWNLSIMDNGIGISETEHGRVFEEFYQVDNPERDRSKGLGLGLSIVKRLADLMALNMQFESSPAVGTCFTFTLPYASQLLVEESIAQEDVISLEGLKVLVVDDEPAVLEGMETLLTLFGCQVAVAQTTGEALEAYSREAPDIALVDHRLRGTESGITAINQLREKHPKLPAIIISGDTDPNLLNELHAAGITLLNKPVPREILHTAIASLCAK